MATKLDWQKAQVREQIATTAQDRRYAIYARTTRRAIRAAVMPWGKHRGRRLSAIPQQYLEWLQDQRPPDCPLRHAIVRELFRRHHAAKMPPS